MRRIKRCDRCRKYKGVHDFHANKARPDGLAQACKTCARAYKRELYERGGKARASAKRKTPLGRYDGYCYVAEQRGLEFSITLDLFAALTAQPCTYCGQFSPGRPYCGIDRIDSSKGYTPENVQSCCKTCNIAKHTLSHEEYVAHVRRSAKHLGFVDY